MSSLQQTSVEGQQVPPEMLAALREEVKQARSSGKVLYHPRFGQPRVINPSGGSAKRGCISLRAERRARELARSTAADAGRPAPKAPLSPNADLRNWIKEARTYLIRVETALQIQEMTAGGVK